MEGSVFVPHVCPFVRSALYVLGKGKGKAIPLQA